MSPHGGPASPHSPGSPLCTAMTGRWCCVKLLRRGEESCGEGLLKGDLSISVFTLGEMPVGPGGGVVALGAERPTASGCNGGAVRAASGRTFVCSSCLQPCFALVHLCVCERAKIGAGVRRCVCASGRLCVAVQQHE